LTAPDPTSADATTQRGPASPWELALACNRLALQGFGGVLALAQHEFVDRRGWLTPAEFVDLLAVSQLLPGPNVINLALMLGERHFGARGVLAALAGMLSLPLLLALGVVSLAQGWLTHPLLAGALRGMGLAAAGLLLGACWKLAQPLRASPLGWPRALGLAGIAFVLVGVLRLPLTPTLLALVAAGMALAWRS
jgi:chromate transporter